MIITNPKRRPSFSLLVDFDSTFVSVESLEELADLTLVDPDDKEAMKAAISQLTNDAMNGTIGFGEALNRRLTLLKAFRCHLPPLIERLRVKISQSFESDRHRLAAAASQIWIISGGFHEYIEPVVEQYGIPADHVVANRFCFDRDRIVGADSRNPLAHDGGKIAAAKRLDLKPPIYALGDGMTDLELELERVAERCFISSENVRRPMVLAAGGSEVKGLGDVLDLLDPHDFFSKDH